MKTMTRRLLGSLIVLASALALTLGMSMTAYAGTSYSDYENNPEKIVKFNNIDWYVIEDNSSAPNAGSVTLLSTSFLDESLADGSTIEFDTNGNTTYNESTLKQWLDSYYAENFKGVDSTVRITQVDGQDTRLYLLSVDEAQRLSDGILAGKHEEGFSVLDWWLRTAGATEGTAAYVLAGANSGAVTPAGIGVTLRNHVRAALKLNLSRVSFDAATSTFTPLVCYTDYDNGVRTEKFCSNCKVFDSSSTNVIGSNSSNGEWIAIEGTVDYPYRIRVSGNASIILKDGATLNATKGIEVSAGNSLTIYSQTDARMGRLNATATQGAGNNEEGNAGIGGSNLNSTENCGTITINGGIIFAQGGDSSAQALSGAGIGGGYHGDGGTVTINGGKVTAVGGDDSAGIGGGFQGHTHGTVTLGSDVAVKAGADESSATVVTDSFANDHSQKWVHTEGVFEEEPNISKTVTFKVANGSWDDGTTDDKKVTLAGYEGDLLYLAQDQIPKVGTKPNENYKIGVWDTTPNTTTVIAEDTVYTYTYAKDINFPVTVTFKVVNGAWNTGYSGDVTVTLPKPNGAYLLEDWEIPAVGYKPADRSFKKGSWDTEPKESLVAEDTVYTYTYAKRDMVTSKVRFSVEGGTWNDGTSDVKEVTLSDYEGYPVRLNNDQIPEVGANPDSTHKKDGYWNMWPPDYVNTMGDIDLVYKYSARQPVSHTVTFKVENGSWDDGTTEDKTVTLTGLEGDTLKLAEDQIPKADTKPAENYIRGRWVTPGPSSNTAITEDTTYTYRYWDKSAAVPYLEWDEGQKQLVEQTGDDACPNFEIVDANTSAFEDGKWYAAQSDVINNSSRITVNGTAHLILEDGVTFQALRGISVAEGSTLYIHSQSEGSDAGSLVSKAWWQTNNAGIGSDGSDGAGTAGGTIVIDGANVTAEGVNGGAGIGGGRGGSGGTVVVNGGAVSAGTSYVSSEGVDVGSYGGAGIGGGENGAGGTITINGGSVSAKGDAGAAIGGGYKGTSGTITINGGTVNAAGGDGAAIGGGRYGAGKTITIHGGTVTAGNDSGAGAGIGGGENAAAGSVSIKGGTISARSFGGAAIGGGKGENGTGGTVTIEGGAVTAKSFRASAIGGGQDTSDNGTVNIIEPVAVEAGEDEQHTIAISNTDYVRGHTAKYVFTERHAPVTYLDWDNTQKKLVEKTCTSYVFADRMTWGVDGGWVVVRGDVTMEDPLAAYSTSHLILMDGAKLTLDKGLVVHEGVTLNIYGQSGNTGELLATGQSDYWSAGIGGVHRTCGTITINGGKITAVGGSDSAGIGGGSNGAGGTITINGGDVTAKGGDRASGIGGGFQAAGGTVTINGGTVDAAGSNSAGIGAGMYSDEHGSVTLGEQVFVLAGDYPRPETDVTASFERKHDQKYVRTAKSDLLEHVEYRAWDEESVRFLTKACVNYDNITSETTTLTPEKWYVVDGNVTIDERIVARGAINLILKDGSTLTASKGITVDYGYSLNVYGQENGTGKLIATGTSGAAGIGLEPGASTCGAVAIHGGEVVVTGGQGGAGIGGGQGGSGGDVAIYGGTVKASGTNAVGIGAGQGEGIHNALALGKGVFLYGGESAEPEKDLSNYVGKKNNDYARNTYMVVNNAVPQHTHHYTYTAGEGDAAKVLTATCLDEDCPDSYGDDHHFVTLTINAPSALGGTATLDGVDSFNAATGNALSAADVKYFKGADGEWTALNGAPAANDEGDFRATIGVFEEGVAKAEASIGWHQHDRILFQLWTAADSLPTSAGSYCLAGNVTLSQEWDAPVGTTNLCLNGHEIKVNSGCLVVGDENTLNLYDEHTGDAAGTVRARGQIFNLADSGSMNMYGGKIADSPSGSGGVGLHGNAQFHMYGGEISNCYFGVYLSTDSPKFVMHDGVITGSKSEGVHIENGSFVMENGAITNGNTGVNVIDSSVEFKLSGTNISPQITGNTRGVLLPDRTIDVEPGTTLAETARISVVRTDKYGDLSTLKAGPIVTGLVVPEGVFTSDSKHYGVRIRDNGAETYLLPVPIKPIEDVELVVGYSEGSIIAIAEVDTDFYSKTLSYEWYSCDSEGNKTSDTPIKAEQYNIVDDKYASYPIETGKAAGTTEYYYCEITAKAKYGGDASTAKSNVVAVTVIKPRAEAVTVTANTPTYNGVEQELASVSGEATGGTMWYALGENETDAPAFDGTSQNADKKWSTSVPKATDAGTYYVWYKAVGDDEHSDSLPACVGVNVGKADIKAATVALSQTNFTYDGTAKEPAVESVKLGDKTLVVDTDYTVSYADNVNAGTAKAIVTGTGNYAGTASAEFSIAGIDISKAEVTLAQASFVNDGKAKEPAVEVKLDGKALTAGVDYDISYADNVNVGTATVTVAGKGNYAGTVTAKFTIEAKPVPPADANNEAGQNNNVKPDATPAAESATPAAENVEGTSAGVASTTSAIVLGKASLTTVVHPGAKTVKAQWKKVKGAKKYQLQWRERGGKWKTKKVKSPKATIKGLKSGKLYDLRVRAVAGKQKGAWSTQSHRWVTAQTGVKAKASKAGAVRVTWKKTAKANAGYKVIVRYSKSGKAQATKTVKAGKTGTTMKGLVPGKKVWVEVRPLRKAGSTVYSGAFMRTKKSVKVAGKAGAKTQSTQTQTESGALTTAAPRQAV